MWAENNKHRKTTFSKQKKNVGENNNESKQLHSEHKVPQKTTEQMKWKQPSKFEKKKFHC